MNKNSKVPMAILSCFLIAFIIQGILKLCGILVFEKALDWEIFEVIDNTLWLSIIYYSIINFIAVYCLSFALTTKPYSNKWYHYVFIIIGSFGITTLRMLIKTPMQIEYIYDFIAYILIPIIVNFTTSKNNKICTNNKLNDIILTISMHILLYFFYLGLSYWSNLLNSLIPITQTILYSSTHFLIYFEIYIGLITLMLSLNIMIKNLKGEENMNWPSNIANDIAKKKAKKQKIDAKILKLNEKSNQLAKEIAELENDEDKK